MKFYEQLLLENKAWSKEMQENDPQFFKRMAKTQTPTILWIGCSDSRVSPSEITQTGPGEIFIHRNIANLVVHTDFNLLSVLQYAVEVLEIRHIIVCGHYGCGGVQAALTRKSLGTIDQWIRHLKDTYRLHRSEIDALVEGDLRTNRLVEINVREQVYNLANTALIQKTWAKHQRPALHGWVYNMEDGLIDPILEVNPGDALQAPVYEYDNMAGN